MLRVIRELQYEGRRSTADKPSHPPSIFLDPVPELALYAEFYGTDLRVDRLLRHAAVLGLVSREIKNSCGSTEYLDKLGRLISTGLRIFLDIPGQRGRIAFASVDGVEICEHNVSFPPPPASPFVPNEIDRRYMAHVRFCVITAKGLESIQEAQALGETENPGPELNEDQKDFLLALLELEATTSNNPATAAKTGEKAFGPGNDPNGSIKRIGSAISKTDLVTSNGRGYYLTAKGSTVATKLKSQLDAI